MSCGKQYSHFADGEIGHRKLAQGSLATEEAELGFEPRHSTSGTHVIQVSHHLHSNSQTYSCLPLLRNTGLAAYRKRQATGGSFLYVQSGFFPSLPLLPN